MRLTRFRMSRVVSRRKTAFPIRGAILVAVLVLLGSSLAASADTVLDLTSAGASGSINGAIFQQIAPQPTGTGVIDSFVRVSAANQAVVEGANTSARPVGMDEITDPNYTRDLLLSDVPIVNIGGLDYYQFQLDINEASGHNNQYLSLSKLKIYTSAAALSTAPGSVGALDGNGDLTLRYNLDATPDGNAVIALDYSLNSGSGSGDMQANILTSVFGADTDYVTLYSEFGGDLPVLDASGVINSRKVSGFTNSDGYEEWSVFQATPPPPPPPVPEPSSTLLLGIGLLGLGVYGRKKIRVRG